MTSPTAPAAGVHLPWARVPAAVQDWAARFGAGPPRPCAMWSGASRPGPPAFWSGPAGPSSSRRSGSELNPDSPGMHRREIVISSALPRSARFPRLLDTYDDGTWVALAFEVVAGRPPRHPWDADELGRVVAALASLHDELTPSPGDDLGAAGRLCRCPLRWLVRAGRGGVAAGPRSVGRGPPRPVGRARGLVAGRLRRLDPGPWRRPFRQRAACRRRRGLRGLASCGGGKPGLRPRRLGPLGRTRGRSGARDAACRSTDRPGGSIPTSSRCCWRPSPASSWRIHSGRLRRGSRPCVRSRRHRARSPWPGCRAGRDGELQALRPVRRR